MRSKSRRRLNVEAMESRTLLSTLIAETEPNNRRGAADVVTFDLSDGRADFSGHFGSRIDQDFFHFTAATDGSVHLRFESADPAGRMVVTDRVGHKLFETEPRLGILSGGFTVRAGQDVFVAASGGRQRAADYTAHLTLSAKDTVLAETEPNNVKATANAIDVGDDGILRLEGISRGHRDSDLFVFTPTVSGTVAVAVQSASAKLELEDSLGHKLLETEPRNGINSGLIQVTSGSRYFVRLRSRDVRPAAYLVDLVSVGTGTTGSDGEPANVMVETEPNNDQASADAIDLGSDGVLRLHGISGNQTDKDFFKFTPTQNGTLGVAVSGTTDPGTKLEVEDSQGTKLFETEPNDGVNSGSFQVTVGSTYFIRTRSPDTRPAAYLVDLAFTADNSGGEPGNVAQETEPNDDQGSANPIDLGSDGILQLQGTSNNQDDRDFFVLTPAAGGTLAVNVQSASGPVAKLEVEDTQGLKLFETEPNDGLNSGSFQVTAGSTYIIRLQSPDTQPAAYLVDLALDSTGTGGDGEGGGSEPGNELMETETNDDPVTANSADLGSDGILQLQGTSTSHDDKDYFVITPKVSGALSLSVKSTAGPVAKLEVEDSQSVTLFETEPNDGVNSGSLPVVAGTTYFIRLRSPDDQLAAYLVDLALA